MTFLIVKQTKGNRDMRNLSNGRSNRVPGTYMPRVRLISVYADRRGPDPTSIVSGRDNYWK